MKSLFFFFFSCLSTVLFGQYQGLLWKISGNGLEQPSFLFGTMHTADSRAFNKIESVKNKLAGCDAFAMEILADEKDIDLNLIAGLLMTDGTTLSSLFTKEEYKRIDSLMQKSSGFPLSLFEFVQPIVIAMLFEQSGMTTDSTDALDFYLKKIAQKEGKKLIGIETIQEQLKALQALTYTEQAALVSQELNKQNDSQGTEQLFKFYASENLDSILILNRQNPMPEKLEKALVENRNKLMTDRIATIIRQQPTFCAIGALHLPAAGGVIEGLRQKGFKLESVQ